jgi:hypothetical protein
VSKQRSRVKSRPARKAKLLWWAIPSIAALALAVVVGQGLFSSGGAGRAALDGPRDNVKGSAAAPVEVEEWGDFQ